LSLGKKQPFWFFSVSLCIDENPNELIVQLNFQLADSVYYMMRGRARMSNVGNREL
jgi:hypothetical protein